MRGLGRWRWALGVPLLMVAVALAFPVNGDAVPRRSGWGA